MIGSSRLVLFLILFKLFTVSDLDAEQEIKVASWQDGYLTQDEYKSWLRFLQTEDHPEALEEAIYIKSMAAASVQKIDDQTRFDLEAKVLQPALKEHVLGKVTVTDEEVKAAYRAYPDAFQRPRKLRLRHIYKRLSGSAEQAREVRARMDELREQWVDGADFKQLARTESESQNRTREGRLGWLDPEELPTPIRRAVKNLKPNEISEVVEHDEGLTLWLCEEVREATKPPREEVQTKLRHNLIQQRKRQYWTDFQQRLLKEANFEMHPTAKEVVLEMDDYHLKRAGLDALIARRWPERSRADLKQGEIEKLLRNWALLIVQVRQARRERLDQRPDLAAALKWRELQFLAHAELVRRVDQRLTEPSEKEIRQHFEARRKTLRTGLEYQLAVIHFATPQNETQDGVRQAQEVTRQIRRGELTFEEAARQYSIHPSADTGGRIDAVTVRQLAGWGPGLQKIIKPLKKGEATDLLRLASGLWLFEYRGRQASRPLSFEESREFLKQTLRSENIRQLEAKIREEQLEALKSEGTSKLAEPAISQD